MNKNLIQVLVEARARARTQSKPITPDQAHARLREIDRKNAGPGLLGRLHLWLAARDEARETRGVFGYASRVAGSRDVYVGPRTSCRESPDRL